jgi:hypothetical protein
MIKPSGVFCSILRQSNESNCGICHYFTLSVGAEGPEDVISNAVFSCFLFTLIDQLGDPGGLADQTDLRHWGVALQGQATGQVVVSLLGWLLASK